MPLCDQDFCSQPGRLTCLHMCPDYYISHLAECAWSPFDRQPWLCRGWGWWHREETGSLSHETDRTRGTLSKPVEKFISGSLRLAQGQSCLSRAWSCSLSCLSLQGRDLRQPSISTIIPRVQCSNLRPSCQTAQDWMPASLLLSSVTLGKWVDLSVLQLSHL